MRVDDGIVVTGCQVNTLCSLNSVTLRPFVSILGQIDVVHFVCAK